MASDPWPIIHAERKALLADLEGLSDAQWDSPSQCAGWTVRDVVSHMAAAAKVTPGSFFPGMIASGFRFNTFQQKGIANNRGASPAETMANFADRLTATTHPPGPVDTMLGETVLHSEDIRRPLGISHTYPTEALTRLADFYKKSNLIIGSKKRVAGLSLRATDTDWSTGSGPEVSGPMLSLVLAMTGRKAALGDLSGDGVAVLKERP
jgi:uncharacterized protein (TIGR03083 family)